MRNFIAFCLLLVSISALPAIAVDDGQVKYIGGTAPGVSAGVIGRLDTTPATALTFEYSGNKLAIPYDAIQSFSYSTEVSRHLGVLPAIVIGMFKMRRHQHFFRIAYRDSNNVAQVVVLEVPKHMPLILRAVLDTRAPEIHKPCLPCLEQN
jgi:hypothetical protein